MSVSSGALTSDGTSDVDAVGPPVSKPKLSCPTAGCGAIFNSRTSLYRHRKAGCFVPRVDRRLAVNRDANYRQSAPQGQQMDAFDCGEHHPNPPYRGGESTQDGGDACNPDEQPSYRRRQWEAGTQEEQSTVEPQLPVGSHLSPSPRSTSMGTQPSQSPPPPPISITNDDSEARRRGGWGDTSMSGGGYGSGSEEESVLGGEESGHSQESSTNNTGTDTSSGDDEAADHEEGVNRLPRVYGSSACSTRRTAQWYVDRMDEPLYTGSIVTVAQHSYALLRAKLDNHLTDKYVDELCKYNATVLLPSGNNHPPSLHLLKKVCAVEELVACEKHVCAKDCVRFDDLKPGEYAAHAEDKCPVCNTSRFVPGKRAGTLLVPRKVYYEVAVEAAIHGLFADTEWSSLRGRSRYEYNLDFYSSPEARRLDLITGGALANQDNSAYEIGFDYFQCFNFKQHSVGIVGMRCAWLCPMFCMLSMLCLHTLANNMYVCMQQVR